MHLSYPDVWLWFPMMWTAVLGKCVCLKNLKVYFTINAEIHAWFIKTGIFQPNLRETEMWWNSLMKNNKEQWFPLKDEVGRYTQFLLF